MQSKHLKYFKFLYSIIKVISLKLWKYVNTLIFMYDSSKRQFTIFK